MTNHKIVSIQETNTTPLISWPKKQYSSLEFNLEIGDQVLRTVQNYLTQNEIGNAIFGIRALLWQLLSLSSDQLPAFQAPIKAIWDILHDIPNHVSQFNTGVYDPTQQIFTNSIEILELGVALALKTATQSTQTLTQEIAQQANGIRCDYSKKLEEEAGVVNSSDTEILENDSHPYTALNGQFGALSFYNQSQSALTIANVAEIAALITYLHLHKYLNRYTPNLEPAVPEQHAIHIAALYQELVASLFVKHPKKAWKLLSRVKNLYRAYSIKTDHAPLAKDILSELLKGYLRISSSDLPLWIHRRNALAQFRQRIVENLRHEISPANISATFKELVKDIWKESMSHLGLPPCKWALLAFGSMSRNTMTPYSDFEYAVLIETDTPDIQAYFTAVSELVKLNIVLLGETPFKDSRGHVFGLTGFHVDSTAGDNGAIIIKAPQTIERVVRELPGGLLHSLYHHQFLDGDETLHRTLVLSGLSSDHIRLALEEDIKITTSDVVQSTSFEERHISLKSWQKLLEYSIQAMTDFEHIQQRDIFECLNSISEEAIPSVIKTHLRKALLFLYQLRCKIQLHTQARVDEIRFSQLSPAEQVELQTIYDSVMMPLIQQGVVQEYTKQIWIQAWLEKAMRFSRTDTNCIEKNLRFAIDSLELDPTFFQAKTLHDRLMHQRRIRQITTVERESEVVLRGLFSDREITILMDSSSDGEMTIHNDYPGLGNHIVLNKGPIHLKIRPEYPAVEYAVSRFFYGLFGHGAPYCEMGTIDVHARKEVVLISETISGELLPSILPRDPSLRRVNQPQLQELIIAMMLIDQEDGKPGNFMLNSENSIVCFDNDHAFCAEQLTLTRGNTPQEVLQGERVCVAIKNILFCLDQMNESVDMSVIQKIARLDIYAFLKNWIYEQKDMDSILTQDEALIASFREYIESNGQNGVATRLFLKPGYLLSLYDRLERLKHRCSDQSKPAPTLIELFKLVAPVIAKFYEWELRENLSPYQRFKRIENGQYLRSISELVSAQSREMVGHELSRLNSIESLRSKLGIVFDKKLSLTEAIRQQKVAMVDIISEELDGISFKSGLVPRILEEIQRGSLESWRALGIPHIQEQLLNTVSWDTLPGGIEAKLLHQLKQFPTDIQELTFRNSQLADSDLSAILEKSPKLTSLHLLRCLQLRGGFVDKLSPLPYLERVVISNSNISTFSNDYFFQDKGFLRLQSMRLDNCLQLTKVALVNCPCLLHLTVVTTPLLQQETIKLNGSVNAKISTTSNTPNSLVPIIAPTDSAQELLMRWEILDEPSKLILLKPASDPVFLRQLQQKLKFQDNQNISLTKMKIAMVGTGETINSTMEASLREGRVFPGATMGPITGAGFCGHKINNYKFDFWIMAEQESYWKIAPAYNIGRSVGVIAGFGDFHREPVNQSFNPRNHIKRIKQYSKAPILILTCCIQHNSDELKEFDEIVHDLGAAHLSINPFVNGFNDVTLHFYFFYTLYEILANISGPITPENVTAVRDTLLR